MAKTGLQFIGSLQNDQNAEVIQIGSAFQTADATTSPKNSPLAYTNSVITITVPDRAVEMIVNPTTDMRVSEIVAMSTYDVIKANTKESIPCAKQQFIYIIRDASDGTLNFRFTLV